MYTRILTSSDVRQIVSRVGLDVLMDETIRRLNDAFLSFDDSKVVVPAREGFHYESPDMGLLEWMPCMRAGECAHIKVVGYHPHNGVRHDLPTILSTLSMYGLKDGHLRGVMDATFVTALRTGAASAIASRILASPDSTSLGIIGCGAQAVTQLHALSREFRFKDVYIYDTDESAMASFTDRITCLGITGLHVHAASPDEFLDKLDILCTATSVGVGEGPVFQGSELKSHIHINAIGSDFPGKVELPKAILQQSLVCPDFAEQALKEGECQQLQASAIGPDIHTLVKEQSLNQNIQGRSTVFDSTGWAVEDMVCMDMFMDYAADFDIGTDFELEAVSSDHKNPYQFLFEGTLQESSETKNPMLKRII